MSNQPGCAHDWAYQGEEKSGGVRYLVWACTKCGWTDRQQA